MQCSHPFTRWLTVALSVARTLTPAAEAVRFSTTRQSLASTAGGEVAPAGPSLISLPSQRVLRLSLPCIAAMSASLFLAGCGGSFSVVQTSGSLSPTITSVSPVSTTADGASLKLNINGTNFTQESSTSWGTTPLATNYVATTQLSVAVPTSLVATPSTASLTVSTTAGTARALVSTSGGVSPEIAIVSSPTITSLSPASATAGGAAFTLTMSGTSFTSDSIVNWGGTALTTTYVSATKLTAAVPASLIAAAGTAGITVTTAGGTSSAATFAINQAKPAITSLSPNSVVQDSAAFTLTVNGSNFLPGTGTTVVRWGSTALTTTYVSSTQLTAVVPASLITGTGTVNVSVVAASTISSSLSFAINPATPAITASLSPSSVSAGSDAFSLSIIGTHFTSTATINWNATPLVTTLLRGNTLVAEVPASLVATPGTASITVTTAGGTSDPVTFTIKQILPVITGVSPSSIKAGSAKFTLTVNGTNFISKTEVWLKSTHLVTTYVSSTQLTAAVPASLIATAGVTGVDLYTPGVGWSTSVAYTINEASPTITGLSPAPITAGGAGFMLTIKGTALTQAATSMWGTTSMDTIYVSPTQLTAAVPASLIVNPGTANVTVTTAAGTSAPFSLTIKPAPPAISGLSPSLVMAGGGAFTLAISGEYFTSASAVKWGSTTLATTYISATALAATVPAALIADAGTASITVTTVTGTSYPAPVTINAGIEITTVALPSGTAGNAYSGPITVVGGVPGYNWRVTGLPGSYTYFNTNGSTLTITGTPASAGAVTFQVSVEDTSGNRAGPVAYTINVAAGPDGAKNSSLNGSYVCLLQGFIDDDGSRWASLYSFKADGQGNFTSGILDTNSHSMGSASGTMDGSYNIGSDNNGVASIHTVLNDGAAGIQTAHWAVALAGSAHPAQQFRMVEDDDLGTLPSGQQGTANCYLAAPSAFAASTIRGKSFAFGLEGEDNSDNPKASAGLFSVSDTELVSGAIDTALGGSATMQTLFFMGSYTAPDSVTGRFTVALNDAGTTTGFTVYMIDANRMFVLDNTSNDGEQAGNMRTQQQATYSGASLSGPSVLYTRGAEFNNGGVTPSGFYANLFEQTGDNNGNMTVNQSYTNDNGSYSAGSAKGKPLALAFDSTYPGRVTFPSANGTTVLYLFDTNSGFAMNVNAAGSLDSGWLEPQTQAAVSDTVQAGNGLYGELTQLDVYSNSSVGEFSLIGNGAIMAAMSTSGQDVSSWDQSVGMTYSTDATASGTGTSLLSSTESQASCAVLNAAKFVCVSQTDSAPTIEVIEQN